MVCSARTSPLYLETNPNPKRTRDRAKDEQRDTRRMFRGKESSEETVGSSKARKNPPDGQMTEGGEEDEGVQREGVGERRESVERDGEMKWSEYESVKD